MTWINATAAASLLAISRATLYRLVLARDYDRRLASGELTEKDVPEHVRGYLGHAFPLPVRLGKRCVRFDEEAIIAWRTARSVDYRGTTGSTMDSGEIKSGTTRR